MLLKGNRLPGSRKNVRSWQYQHAILVGQHSISRMHHHTATTDRTAELTIQSKNPGRYNGRTARPYRHAMLAQLAEVSYQSIHDQRSHTSLARRISHGSAECRRYRLAATVNHENVSGSRTAHRMMQNAAVRARHTHGDSRTRYPDILAMRPDARIHKAYRTKMPYGGGLCAS